MNTTYNTTTATTTPTQQPEPVATPENNVPSKSRRQIIEELKSGQDGYPVKYFALLTSAIREKTGDRMRDIPKAGTVIVSDKNIPWYFRFYNYLKTQPARDVEAIENDARKLRTRLEMRIKAGQKGFYYEIETSKTAEEYISVIIELYSTKGRTEGNISEIEMHDIIGHQIKYAMERFDKTGDRFSHITNAAIDFWNVATVYEDIYLIDIDPYPAPTPEATTAPEEVKEVTTSKQETPPATPEDVKQEEPMHAPQMLKKIIEEQKKRASEGTNTIPLKTAVGMTTEVLTQKRAKELLDDDFNGSNTYILVDGTHIVETERPTLDKNLYISDISPEYNEYKRGNISAVKLYRDDMMSLYSPARRLEAVRCSPSSLKVIRSSNNLLQFERCGQVRYGYQQATPDEVEIYKAAMRASYEAFSKRLDNYLKRYGSKIYVSSYWANR